MNTARKTILLATTVVAPLSLPSIYFLKNSHSHTESDRRGDIYDCSGTTIAAFETVVDVSLDLQDADVWLGFDNNEEDVL